MKSCKTTNRSEAPYGAHFRASDDDFEALNPVAPAFIALLHHSKLHCLGRFQKDQATDRGTPAHQSSQVEALVGVSWQPVWSFALHVFLRFRACAIYGLGLAVHPVQQAARSIPPASRGSVLPVSLR